ncbi:hypothetical protein [Maridesulfovibrio zosterae]|uniref:hypothetical protein n=1 Tax=Maridesulfovibrio zosterae TaxID=82171 RepID=UPI0004839452|nr:hypothetical protein [Maridesulfovibrio zosterae]
MKSRFTFCVLVILISALSGCITPPAPTLDLPQEKPAEKNTEYSTALEKFGEMINVYYYSLDPKKRKTLYVSAKPFIDKTGVNAMSQGEIPEEMTDMVKSAVNRIGPNVRYAVGDYDYTINTKNIYGNAVTLRLPEVIIDGGLTEFDRGLKGTGGDIGGSASVGTGVFSADIEANAVETQTMSRITIDMNLIDFKSQLFVPKMQATNTIKVYKGMSKYDLGFAIFGTGFGGGGTASELQGRHAALRLLIDCSVLELLGRYLKLPYWKCVDGGKADKYVLNQKRKGYVLSNKAKRIECLQYYLMYHGYFDVRPTGQFNDATKKALDDFIAANKLKINNYLDPELFLAIYSSVPLNVETVHKAEVLYQQDLQKALAETKSLPEKNTQQFGNKPKAQAKSNTSADESKYLTFMRAAKKAFASGDYATAEDLLDAAFKVGTPAGEAEPFLYVAYVQLGLKKTELAGRSLERGISLVPNSIELYKAYVRFLVSQNQVEKAKTVLDKAISIAPGNKELEYLKSYLKMASK